MIFINLRFRLGAHVNTTTTIQPHWIPQPDSKILKLFYLLILNDNFFWNFFLIFNVMIQVVQTVVVEVIIHLILKYAVMKPLVLPQLVGTCK